MFVSATDSNAPIKNVRVKVKSKPWFDTDEINTIHTCNKFYNIYKKLGKKIDKDIFRKSRSLLHKVTSRKKSFTSRYEWKKSKKTGEESLGLPFKRNSKAKVSLKEDGVKNNFGTKSTELYYKKVRRERDLFQIISTNTLKKLLLILNLNSLKRVPQF